MGQLPELNHSQNAKVIKVSNQKIPRGNWWHSLSQNLGNPPADTLRLAMQDARMWSKLGSPDYIVCASFHTADWTNIYIRLMWPIYNQGGSKGPALKVSI